MRKIQQLAGSILAASAVALAGCGSDDNGAGTGSGTVQFDAKSLIDNVTDNVIVSTYTGLNTRAGDLLTAVQALQDNTATEAELDAAQAAWRAARVPWESSEGFLFGPVDSLGIDPAIDSWPLNTPDLQAFIASNPSATQADVENAGDDLRGFHAIEYLLFGDGVNDNDKSATELGGGELAYLVALAQAFVSRTGQLADSWTNDFNGAGPFASLVKDTGATGNTTYVSQGAVMEELINGVAGITDEVVNAKIAEPLAQSAATADTSLVESQYSWNSLTDFHNNVQSILNVYTGQAGYDPATSTIAAGTPGIYAFVSAHDAALADRVLAEIVDAQRKIALIKGDGVDSTTDITGLAKPFREQISDATGRALISDAITSLNTLLNSLNNNVLPLVNQTSFGTN